MPLVVAGVVLPCDYENENIDITLAILGQGKLGHMILGKSESDEIKYITLDGSAILDGTFKLT